jgi:hypothetical protein
MITGRRWMSSALVTKQGQSVPVPAVYELFKETLNGELVEVSAFDRLEEAVKLLARLHSIWPGKYLVRDSEGTDVDTTG